MLVCLSLCAVPLSELFKKTSSSWDCSTCLVNNKNESSVCIACAAPRPAQNTVNLVGFIFSVNHMQRLNSAVAFKCFKIKHFDLASIWPAKRHLLCHSWCKYYWEYLQWQTSSVHRFVRSHTVVIFCKILSNLVKMFMSVGLMAGLYQIEEITVWLNKNNWSYYLVKNE